MRSGAWPGVLLDCPGAMPTLDATSLSRDERALQRFIAAVEAMFE